MTKKISSILARSNMLEYSWNSKYFWINNENLSLRFFEEINIQKYITRIFQIYGLLIHSCKINISKFKLEIVICYYITLKAIKLIKINTFSKNNLFSNNKYVKNIDFQFKTILQEKQKNKFKTFVNKKYDNFEIAEKSDVLEKFIYKFFENFVIFNRIPLKVDLVFTNINKGLSTSSLNNIETVILKKLLMQLRIYKNNRYFNAREFINILLIVVKKRNSAKFFAEFLAHQMRYLKRHNVLLSFVKRSLYLLINSPLSRIKGAKIVIKGRFNGKLRANKTNISIGEIPMQTLSSRVSYGNSVSYTPYGTFGIKIWLAEC